MTAFLVLCFLGLQVAFIWARYAVFRVDGRMPPAARIIEGSAAVCILSGTGLIVERTGPNLPLDSIALGMALCSAALFAWAVLSTRPRQLSVAFSPDAPAELLQHGAFGFVRNPFYLAYMLGFALPAVAARSVWGCLLGAWMVGVYLRAVRMEERKFQAGPLAEDYRRYCSMTGRFLPRLTGRVATTGERHGY